MSELQTTYLLDAPVAAEDAIRNPNFFNGRVLTARDMQDEQLANRRQHRQLGRAIGAGIVSGLEVRLVSAGGPSASPLLAISGGLAINREGQAIELPVESVQVALSRRKQPPPPRIKVFDDCAPPQSAPDLVGKGVYLLTIAPQAEYRERAPMVSLNSGGRADGCGDRYAVEGVRFGLLELDLLKLGGISADERNELATLLSRSEQNNLTPLERLTARSRLRNLLAYACFGSATLAELRADPFGATAPATGYGILDALWAGKQLQACEVPLALLIWTNAGVRVVDMWAVRRRPHQDDGATLAPSERLFAEGEAMRAQLADHLTWLLGELSFPQRASARAITFLRYLPPAGIIPIAGGNRLGFTYPNWWAGVAHRNNGPRPNEVAPFMTGVPILENAVVASLLHEALAYPPIDLVSATLDEQTQRPFVWLFQVRENCQAINRGAQPPVQPYLIFANGCMPEYGAARFNQARWGYSNFA